MNPSRSMRRIRRDRPTLTEGISSRSRAYNVVRPSPKYMAASSGRSHTFGTGSIVLFPKNTASFQSLAKDKGPSGTCRRRPFLWPYLVVVHEGTS
jgi:hypothetical protein